MTDVIESFKDYLPYYLTKEQQDGIVAELERFPENMDYYTSLYPNEMLQGDCWTKFEIFDFEQQKTLLSRGMVISNSCNMDNAETRQIPVQINFVPIITVLEYEKILVEAGLSANQVQAKMTSLKNQEAYSFFYLPPDGKNLNEAHVALLSHVHTIPVERYRGQTEKRKLVTLNMYGFYLFVIKLSMNFCRFHENIDRTKETDTALQISA